MQDRIRHSAPVERLRKALRGKAMRVVDEVMSGYHRRQSEQLAELRAQVDQLRGELAESRAETTRAADRVVEHTTQIEIRSRRDVVAAGEMEAARQSAEFVREQMRSARHFGHPHATLEHALSLAPEGGLALEFGVFSGTTLNIIAKARQGEQVYGFDSFEGLPEDWRASFPTGTFSVDELPVVPGAELVVGWFEDTLPGFLAEHPGPVDFLHVDSDLYSAAKTVLDLVGPRLRPGSVIVFDEFFNYPGWPEHEFRAWREYVDRTGLRFHYEAYTYDNEQVAVRVLGS